MNWLVAYSSHCFVIRVWIHSHWTARAKIEILKNREDQIRQDLDNFCRQPLSNTYRKDQSRTLLNVYGRWKWEASAGGTRGMFESVAQLWEQPYVHTVFHHVIQSLSKKHWPDKDNVSACQGQLLEKAFTLQKIGLDHDFVLFHINCSLPVEGLAIYACKNTVSNPFSTAFPTSRTHSPINYMS